MGAFYDNLLGTLHTRVHVNVKGSWCLATVYKI